MEVAMPKLHIRDNYFWMEWLSVGFLVAGFFPNIVKIPSWMAFVFAWGIMTLTYWLSMRPNPGRILRQLCSIFNSDRGNLTSEMVTECCKPLHQIIALANRRSVRIASTFREYCDCCSEMLSTAGTNDIIYTVQTPAIPVVENADDAFKAYVEKTAKCVLKIDTVTGRHVLGGYWRLIVVDREKADEIWAKLDEFVDALFEVIKEKRGQNFAPKLGHVLIAMVSKEKAAEVFYSNIDIHITSPLTSAVAFQQPKVTERWGASVHLDEELLPTVGGNGFREKLQNCFDALWEKSTAVKLGELYDANSKTDVDAQKESLKVKLASVIKELVPEWNGR